MEVKKTLRLLLITLIGMWVVDVYGQDLPVAPRLWERTKKERWDILVKVALETIKEPENKVLYHKYDSIAIHTRLINDDGKNNSTRCNPLYKSERSSMTAVRKKALSGVTLLSVYLYWIGMLQRFGLTMAMVG